MMQQVRDLMAEGESLRALLGTLDARQWTCATPFKGWTVNDVMQHLQLGDWLATISLDAPEKFRGILAARDIARDHGEGSTGLEGVTPRFEEGPALLDQWWERFTAMCDRLDAADPGQRLAWFGPDMGTRMFTTARQMETWAHGQDIYDLLRRPREHFDRMANICFLGARTYEWTFVNRGMTPPGPMPHLHLVLPSGSVWEEGAPSQTDRIEGRALDFCRVVTQGRNIADVALDIRGEAAKAWMEIAQCFRRTA